MRLWQKMLLGRIAKLRPLGTLAATAAVVAANMMVITLAVSPMATMLDHTTAGKTSGMRLLIVGHHNTAVWRQTICSRPSRSSKAQDLCTD